MAIDLEAKDGVRLRELEVSEEGPAAALQGAPKGEPRSPTPEAPPLRILGNAATAFLATSGAGWMAAGVFRGALPRAVGILGALVGTGLVALSYRSRRPGVLQYFAIPIAIVIGSLFVLPEAKGGTGNLPKLIAEALRTGGLAQPPIAFDPGWRFILMVITAGLGAAGLSLSLGLGRPRLGVMLPVPLVVAAGLVQPKEVHLVSTSISLALLIASLAASYGVELAGKGAVSGRFELRRSLRGVILVLLLVAAMVGLNRATLLFPELDKEEVIPPRKPEPPPPQADRVIFTVESERPGPWRLGVLDVYDGRQWLLPPFDTSRFKSVPLSGTIALPLRKSNEPGSSITATFRIVDMQGHTLPNIANPSQIREGPRGVEYDPRTQALRLTERPLSKGLSYELEAPGFPDGKRLSESPPPAAAIKEFLSAPPAPNEVLALLAEAPPNPWDRLQFVRNAFYQKVIAAGAGNPIPVPPRRVVEMLEGKEASPFEITAGEVLLARWSGIPSRIGYGFYQGDQDPDTNVWSVRPDNGATWLEAYFEGEGWIPIVGIPPRAKASLSQAQRNQNPQIRPTEDLALIIYVPIRLQSIELLYTLVRYWIVVLAPFAASFLVFLAFYPGILKVVRRHMRRRWAFRRGILQRIGVAYAEYRDAATDLNIGSPVWLPVEFLSSTQNDEQHAELAWLVTRAAWGDLRRDLRLEDAEAAEEMGRSLTRRLRRGQPTAVRVLAVASRASLRQPFSDEMPNLWPKFFSAERRQVVRPILRGARRTIRRMLPVGTALFLLLPACASPAATPIGPRLPERIVPPSIDAFSFQREEALEREFTAVGPASLVSGGRVFTIRSADDIVGYIQIASFKPGLEATRPEVLQGVLSSTGTGRFERVRLGPDRVYKMDAGEQQFLLWFPPRGQYMQLLVGKKSFSQADQLFAVLLSYQRGEEVEGAPRPVVTPFDFRRGSEF